MTRVRGAQLGSANHQWKGGRTVMSLGYVLIKRRDHYRTDKNGYVFEHILVAEKALGKPLPSKAVIHHINDCRGENINTNLVICQNQGYHRLIHLRRDAYRATGNPRARRCAGCGKWILPGTPRASFNIGISQRHPSGRAYHLGACSRGKRRIEL